jgi:very-short-patch-repair endonuclease
VYWRIARRAERQHGVVSRAQLRALGLGDGRTAHAVAIGRLHPVFHGVFAVGHPGVGEQGRMLAAVLASGDGTVVSHGTAAALLGLIDFVPAAVHVIAPRQSGRGIPGIRRHYVPRPVDGEVTICDAIPCTNPSRTIVDLAGGLRGKSLRRVVQTAAMLRLLDLPEIDAILDGPRRRGSRYLREILIDWRALPPNARLRSLLEARLFPRLAARGLPIPLCNEKLQVGGRRIEVDFLWPKHRVVVETDGGASHGTIAAFHEDRRRDRDLMLAGYSVLRVTWDQLDNEPEVTLATIAKLLRAASPARSAVAA